MVLLVATLSKLYNKLENHHNFHLHHHHDDSQVVSASRQAFRSEVSDSLNKSHLKPGLETLSLSWFHELFEILPIINKAFGELVVKIEYPLSRWEADSVEEYLSYSLELLDLLNSINSLVSQLGQARLPMSHALSLVEASPDSALDHLSKAIDHLSSVNKDCASFEGNGENKASSFSGSGSGKELVIHEALVVMKSVGFWVCGIVLSALSGHARPYMEMREKAGGFASSLLIDLDSWVSEMVRNKEEFMLKEVRELKQAGDGLVCSMVVDGGGRTEAEELRRQVERYEKIVDGLGREVDALFTEVLAQRNHLLEGLRQMKQ